MATVDSASKRSYLAAASFGSVLGINGLAQAWRLAVPLWGMPAVVGDTLVVVAIAV